MLRANHWLTRNVIDNPLGAIEQYRYVIAPMSEYKGGQIVVGISRLYLGNEIGAVKLGTVIGIGGYRFRVFDPDWLVDAYIGVQESDAAWLLSLVYPVLSFAEKIYRRLIVTAAVWGLADYYQGRIPVWQDLHIAQWWAKRVWPSLSAMWSRD